MLTLRDKIFLTATVSDDYVGKYVSYNLTATINTKLTVVMKLVFSGRVYCPSNSITIYLSDIINNIAYKGELIGDFSSSSTGNEVIMFTITASSNGFTNSPVTDTIICSYPFDFVPITLFDPDVASTSYSAVSINYYVTGNEKNIILPKIPRITQDTKNFYFESIVDCGNRWIYDLQQKQIRIVSKGSDGSYIYYDNMDVPLSAILNIKMDSPTLYSIMSGMAVEIGVASYTGQFSDSYYKVADIDDCNADYYLIWCNRACNYQCQPFHKKVYYNEDITSNTITNFMDETRPYLKEVTPSWTLYSDWLSNAERDEYESILTSPYIYIYITKSDMLLPVICKSTSWERKTNNNNNKPHSMTIELSGNRNQNMIY